MSAWDVFLDKKAVPEITHSPPHFSKRKVFFEFFSISFKSRIFCNPTEFKKLQVLETPFRLSKNEDLPSLPIENHHTKDQEQSTGASHVDRPWWGSGRWPSQHGDNLSVAPSQDSSGK